MPGREPRSGLLRACVRRVPGEFSQNVHSAT